MNKIKKFFQGYTKKDYFRYFRRLFMIVIGTLFLTFGTAAFLTPYNIVTGGISGIGIVIQNIFFKGDNAQNIVDIVAVALNIITFIVGLIFLGKRFAFQTFLSVIIYSISLPLFMRVLKVDTWINLEVVADNMSYDPRMTALLAAICGNVFIGLGCALTFLGGGSTGGVDVFALIGQKYFRIKCAVGTFVIDSIIIAVGFIVTKDASTTMIGIIGAFINAMIIDRILLGSSESFIASIVSDKYQEITTFVIEELDRSTTIIDAIGGYTNGNKKMIQVVFGRKEYTKLIDYIKKIDPSAFVSITRAHEINGEGFHSLLEDKKK